MIPCLLRWKQMQLLGTDYVFLRPVERKKVTCFLAETIYLQTVVITQLQDSKKRVI